VYKFVNIEDLVHFLGNENSEITEESKNVTVMFFFSGWELELFGIYTVKLVSCTGRSEQKAIFVFGKLFKKIFRWGHLFGHCPLSE
jgi:succinate-acetate transporter protein